MEFKDGKINHRYIITKGSYDTTCMIGDIIRLNNDGSFNCSMGGWIDANDVDAATLGMEMELDIKYYMKKKVAAEQDVELYNKIIKEETK